MRVCLCARADYFILACEVIFLLFVTYYAVEEYFEIRFMGIDYFKNMWSWVDMIIILLAYIAAIFSIYRTAEVNDKLDALIANENQYANFEDLGYWQRNFNIMVAISVFIVWIKLFKYLGFNRTMVQMSTTLSKCAKDIIGFAIMFFIVFFAYAQLGYLAFGATNPDFSTFGDSTYVVYPGTLNASHPLYMMVVMLMMIYYVEPRLTSHLVHA